MARTPESERARSLAYNKSPAGRAARKRYRATPKFKDYNKRKQWKAKGIPEPTRPMPERCECCNSLPNGKGALHNDHDHVTKKFRGWICSNCNRGIGYLGDTKSGISFALAYITLNG